MQHSTSFYILPQAVHVKSCYNSQVRHTHLEGNAISYHVLVHRLQLAHAIDTREAAHIYFLFEDPDGDLSPLNDDDQLIGAIRLSASASLKVHLRSHTSLWRWRWRCLERAPTARCAPRRYMRAYSALRAAGNAGSGEVQAALAAASAAVQRHGDTARLRHAAPTLRRRARCFFNARPPKKCDLLISDTKGVLWSYGLANESVEACAALARAMLADVNTVQYARWKLSRCRLRPCCWYGAEVQTNFVVAESVCINSKRLSRGA